MTASPIRVFLGEVARDVPAVGRRSLDAWISMSFAEEKSGVAADRSEGGRVQRVVSEDIVVQPWKRAAGMLFAGVCVVRCGSGRDARPIR